MLLSRQKRAARLFVFTWFFIGGIAHFVIPDLFMAIMPPYIPYPLLCIYITGAFEILGACALLIKPLRNLAGYGLILLTLAVSLANIHMFQHPELFTSIPEWALFVRLPMQGLLIWMIWWASRPDQKPYSFASMKPY